MLRLGLLVLFLLGLFSARAEADERYRFDKDHTAMLFSVSRFGLFELEGQFSAYDGGFVFCAAHPEEDAIAITFYPAGIHTGDDATDRYLQDSDFFNAAEFPKMRFVSTHVKLVDKDNAKITGNLTLLGVTKPVTFDAHFTAIDDDDVVSFTASGVIHRSDFGMDHLIPLIGDEVRLNIQVKGIQEKGRSNKG